jgi:hypothetical protein
MLPTSSFGRTITIATVSLRLSTKFRLGHLDECSQKSNGLLRLCIERGKRQRQGDAIHLLLQISSLVCFDVIQSRTAVVVATTFHLKSPVDGRIAHQGGEAEEELRNFSYVQS